MTDLIRPALTLFVALTLLTGVVYPIAVTGLAGVLFPHRANGSLLVDGDRIAGSELVGQPFSGARYFHGRPSATGPFPYNAGASSGSNLGPLNPALADAIAGRLEVGSGRPGAPVPVDMVTASGSGLDPHISPAAARWQVERVAKARGLDPARVLELVDQHVEGRAFGILGEPRVNVLLANRALDRMQR